MKIVLIIVGMLASIYTIAAIQQFVLKLTNGAPAPIIAASAAPVFVGLIVAILCFQKASRKKN